MRLIVVDITQKNRDDLIIEILPRRYEVSNVHKGRRHER